MPHVGRHCAGEYGLCGVRLCGTPGRCVPTLDAGVRCLAGALVTVIKKASISVQHTLSHIRSLHFARCHRRLTSCRLHSDVARRLVPEPSRWLIRHGPRTHTHGGRSGRLTGSVYAWLWTSATVE